jgi:hypothetical protein
VDLKQTTHTTWGGYGAKANMKFLLGRAKVSQDGIKIEFCGAAALLWSLGKEIIDAWFGITGMRQHEAPAGQRTQYRFGDTGGKVGCNNGIKSIPAFMQDGFCRRNSCGMPGGNDATWSFHEKSTFCRSMFAIMP